MVERCFMTYLCALLALIHWLKGFSLGDNLPPGQTRETWQTVVNFMTSDGFCGVYLAASLGFLLWPGVEMWKPFAAFLLLVAAWYGYACEMFYHKRIMFVAYSGKIEAITDYADNFIERFFVGSGKNPRLSAVRYGVFAGFGYSLLFAIIIAWRIYTGSFSLYSIGALLPPLLYGVVYYAMNLLPNPNQYGETVGRGFYGAALSASLFLSAL